MLKIPRKESQSIMIGDDIKIIIVNIENDEVTLGITFPKELPVNTLELYEAMQQQEKINKGSKKINQRPTQD